MSTRDRDHRETKLTQGPDGATAVRAPQLPTAQVGRRRGESGQAVLEFAMVLPFLCALVLLLVDFGKAMGYWINATQVANEGARLAAVNAPNVADLQTFVQGELFPELKNGSPNVGPHAGATVSVCFPSGKATFGEPVTVKISSSYRVTVLPFLGGSFTLANIPINTSATMRLEHDATSAAFPPVATC